MRQGPSPVLRWLLRLYPPEHRRTYGEEMWEVVRYRHQAEGGGVRFFVETAADLIGGAAGVWFGKRRWRMGGKGLMLDLIFVGRSLRRSPAYSVTALVVVAGAVAVSASVFSFVRGTLLNEPTYPDSERVVVGWGSNPIEGQLRDVVSGPTYLDLAHETNTLEALAAFSGGRAVLMEDGRPKVLDTQEVSVDYFSVFSVAPFLGRVFDERDRTSGAPATVVVSYAFWRDQLGGDPSAVGRALPLNGEPHQVLGVLPEGFEFLSPAPLWIPLRDDLLAADDRGRLHYNLFGKLRPNVTAAESTRELTAIMGRIADEHPTAEGWSVLVEPAREASVLAVRGVLWTLTAAVGLVLLITLVNLATLFRIRTLGRTNEFGVRLALGSGRRRVARVLALEAVSLGLVGALLGVMAAPWLLNGVRELVPLWIQIPDSAARIPVLRATLDPWVVGVSVLLTVLGTVILTAPGLLAAVRQASIARSGRISSSMRGTRWLVMAEVALATVLSLGAGLTGRSASNLLSTDVGIQDRGLLSMWVADLWGQDVADQIIYRREVVRRIEAVAGVASAAWIDYVPFQAEDDYARVYFLDRSFQPVESLREEWRRVSHGAFETAGMTMATGRSFGPDDFEGSVRVAVVNRAFAEKHYPGGQAIGEFLSTHDEAYQNMEIVGIVSDVRSLGPAAPAPPMLYVPYQGNPRGTMALFVRMESGDVLAALDEVKEAIWSVDSTQPIMGINPMTEMVAQWVAIPRATRVVVTGLASMALLLAGLGVFGVVAYGIRSRRSEFGVRLALGAPPERLRRDVMAGTTPLVVLGVLAGLVAGVAAAAAARVVLFGVSPLDPASVAGALAITAGTALLATYLPTRRVSLIDPTEAMRPD